MCNQVIFPYVLAYRKRFGPVSIYGFVIFLLSRTYVGYDIAFYEPNPFSILVVMIFNILAKFLSRIGRPSTEILQHSEHTSLFPYSCY